MSGSLRTVQSGVVHSLRTGVRTGTDVDEDIRRGADHGGDDLIIDALRREKNGEPEVAERNRSRRVQPLTGLPSLLVAFL